MSNSDDDDLSPFLLGWIIGGIKGPAFWVVLSILFLAMSAAYLYGI